ncbi:hypothetical protein EMIHUDRAFT_361574 [Emiliania huxleyi CCMP1516]|uniref:Uncharacterized protein n=2 Tax=Emiliania huxleyi TaxID=2903 RepID=A0A0D3KSM0_EMIH1|nr:hypothetical protein EMIHUDRAFT_361574 [Emiliania huxleyi CCMP1516]EOD38755.1 hypothetical protein EMIHUDRAFT_361574 [Emiliania huxleyi CCMP1516]|eukprot:XP_005791184.1 hypothetical protein EMIHUDRAFT_361574 [Emiliania huxleyi CCMP1516]
MHGRRRVAQLLLSSGSWVDAGDRGGASALHHAAAGGHAGAALACLQAGAAVGATDGAGATPLHHAALAGSADVVRVLLAAGASASQGPGGATPREIALARGHAEVASILERAGGGGWGASLAARVLLAIGAGVVACACVGWASLRSAPRRSSRKGPQDAGTTRASRPRKIAVDRARKAE